MKILSIESSCDETAAAVTENGRTVLSSVISTQIDEHRLYGGVVPEIASRRHCENITGVVKEALSGAGAALTDIDAVAVTYAPGLIGALLVGVSFAKGLSMSAGLPLVPVHHIKGHIAANYIANPELRPPFLCLVASGGHTQIVKVAGYTSFETVGKTVDDAAGEAFDKAARAMGFPYPGGVYIDRAAKRGDPLKYRLPVPKTKNPYDFSFSGLKTAVINLIHNARQRGEEPDADSLAASFQLTAVNMLTDKFILAAKDLGCEKLALAGGVAANSALRETLAKAAADSGMEFFLPDLPLCTDNAAMIGCQGYYEYLAGNTGDLSLNARATKNLRL